MLYPGTPSHPSLSIFSRTASIFTSHSLSSVGFFFRRMPISKPSHLSPSIFSETASIFTSYSLISVGLYSRRMPICKHFNRLFYKNYLSTDKHTYSSSQDHPYRTTPTVTTVFSTTLLLLCSGPPLQ